MTVRQLGSELTYEEMIGWSAYFSLKNDEMDRDQQQARQRSTRTM